MKMLLLLLTLCISAAMLYAQQKAEIPVLCYHHITDEKHVQNIMYIRLSSFSSQMRMLHDSGYTSIGPEDYHDYLQGIKTLPARSFMISFDDGRESQYRLAAPVLQKFGFRGVFYIMTVAVNKPGYMKAAQIAELSASGHTIGHHSRDHPNLKKAAVMDEKLQLAKPKQYLEKITGKPVNSFAYPFGAWNENSIRALEQQGFSTAFQLSAKPHPLKKAYTIRRVMVDGNWTPSRLLQEMRLQFQVTY